MIFEIHNSKQRRIHGLAKYGFMPDFFQKNTMPDLYEFGDLSLIDLGKIYWDKEFSMYINDNQRSMRYLILIR